MMRLFFAVFLLTSNAFADDYGLAGKKIGVQLGTTGDAIASGISGAVVERYNKAGDAVQSLLHKKVDAVILDEQPALDFAETNKSLIVSDTPAALETYAIAVSKRRHALKDELNRVLAELEKDGTVKRILKNYIGDEKGLFPPLPRTAACPNGVLKVATNATFPP